MARLECSHVYDIVFISACCDALCVLMEGQSNLANGGSVANGRGNLNISEYNVRINVKPSGSFKIRDELLSEDIKTCGHSLFQNYRYLNPLKFCVLLNIWTQVHISHLVATMLGVMKGGVWGVTAGDQTVKYTIYFFKVKRTIIYRFIYNVLLAQFFKYFIKKAHLFLVC